MRFQTSHLTEGRGLSSRAFVLVTLARMSASVVESDFAAARQPDRASAGRVESRTDHQHRHWVRARIQIARDFRGGADFSGLRAESGGLGGVWINLL